ncbi:hypothetical protein GCM10027162_73510 [Streptomyces incanus]
MLRIVLRASVVSDVPMVTLVAVMVVVMVPAATFDRHSIRPKPLKRMPLGGTVVMASTVIVVVATPTCSAT